MCVFIVMLGFVISGQKLVRLLMDSFLNIWVVY
jgi:hypothetical protein